MKKNSLLMTTILLMSTIVLVGQVTSIFTDPRDDKKYKTVKIGTQTWMAQNLAYKNNKYPYVSTYKDVKYCYAYNNDENNVTIYGYLYRNIDLENVCPPGWHLPSDTAWTILLNYLGGEDDAAEKLQAKVTWTNPETSSGATNSSGFSALAGGSLVYRIPNSVFNGLGANGNWWSSTYSKFINIGNFIPVSVSIGEAPFLNAFSIRCLKD